MGKDPLSWRLGTGWLASERETSVHASLLLPHVMNWNACFKRVRVEVTGFLNQDIRWICHLLMVFVQFP